MKILVTANHTPFISGGASSHMNGLMDALKLHGHDVELLRLPFTFSPDASIQRLMTFTEELDMNAPNGQSIDRLISLQFPGYGMRHAHHVTWLMHQHRAVYELFDEQTAPPEHKALKTSITDFDGRALGRARAVFTNSKRVTERLQKYNNIPSQPLYHPPPDAEHLYCADAENYIYYPSRLETLKRQDLLIEAARHIRAPVGILISGDGGQHERYRRLIDSHNLHDRVRLLGRVDEPMKRALYAHALGVFFGPYDEDLGYVTLEAMLSAKPVITCTDSGGPLEFITDHETGFICPPSPEMIAARIDWLHENHSRARDMGQAAREQLTRMDIRWEHVVERLISA